MNHANHPAAASHLLLKRRREKNVRKLSAGRSLLAVGLLAGAAAPGDAGAAPYQTAVQSLTPTYYYQLNETSTAAGAIDSTGTATGPSSYNGDYVNGPPMVGGPGPLEVFGGIQVPGVGGVANKAHYSNNAGHIIVGPGTAYGANAITVALFLKAGPAEGGDRIFTNNLADPTTSFQIVTANDGLVVAVDPGTTGLNAERTLFMEDNSGPDRRLIDASNGWFHVVASTSGATGPDRAANIRVWINGIDRTSNLQPNVTGWGIDTAFAKIGGRKDDPTHTTTHSGAQDEVAIWLNRVLTDAEVTSLWAAARRPANPGLKGWWPFDGSYMDVSANALHGTPQGMPDFDMQMAPGLVGQSVLFDFDTEGVRIPASAQLNGAEFTLGYFINLLGTSQSGPFERLSSRDGYGFETAVATSRVLSYYSPGTNWVGTGVTVPSSGWAHVAWRNTPSAMELYLDGALAFTGPRVPAPSGFMHLGSAFNNVEGFAGLMDDAFLWDGTLTPGRITAIAASGIANATTDSDGDGLPDTWEILYGLDPADDGSVNPVNGATGSPDSDGLTNAQEFTLGTKPNDSDTDDDGLNDGNEVTRGTNPLVADTDGDGLTDGDEVTRTTNPLLPDTDGDGISDGDEVTAGTNPLDPLSGPPPSTFLVLHLNCEGNAQDSSTRNNHGTLLNGPAFVSGESPGGGQALSLANTTPVNNQGITVPGHSSLGSNAFTLTYWIKPATLQEGAGLERLTSRSSDSFETAIGNRAAVGGAPDLTLSYYQTTGWHNTGNALALNEWAHVAWRNRGTGAQDMSLFINGQLVFSGPGVPAAGPGSGLMNIGTRHNTVEGFAGLMDDVRLYRAPLSNNAILDISIPVGQAPLDFVSMVRAPGGASVTLTIQSRAGRTYAVDYSTAMNPMGQPGGWVELTDSLASGGAQTVYLDTVASNLPRAYYRARDVTPP